MSVYGLGKYGFEETELPALNYEGLILQGDYAASLRQLQAAEKTYRLIYLRPPFREGNAVDRPSAAAEEYQPRMGKTAYCAYVRNLLTLAKSVMGPKSTIYLHVDSAIAPYLRTDGDVVFGQANFLAESIRSLPAPKTYSRTGFLSSRDSLLVYTKETDYIFHEPKRPLSEEEVFARFRKLDITGDRYTTLPIYSTGVTKNGPTGQPWRGMLPPPGCHWRTDPKELDIWDQKGLLEWPEDGQGLPRKRVYSGTLPSERLGDVWTLKTEEMLRLILETSSEEKDTVLALGPESGQMAVLANALHRDFTAVVSTPEERIQIVDAFDNLQLSL